MAALPFGMLLAIAFALVPPAAACSRIFLNRKRSEVYAARTMDWEFEFKTNLMFIPAGLDMDGGCGQHLPQAEQCKKWTSKYWSMTTSINGWASTMISTFAATNFSYNEDAATDGINEKGLAAQLLYLGSTEYPAYEPVAHGITYMRWVRYLLDTCATVAEAKAAMKHAVILGVGIEGLGILGTHMALSDKSGDSVIFEFVGGTLQQYPQENAGPDVGFGRDFRVMCNDPPFPSQIANRNRFIKVHPDGTSSLTCETIQPGNPYFGDKSFPHRCLPGDITSRARFVRLSWFLDHLNITGRKPNEIAGDLRAVLFSAAVPKGAPDTDPWDNGVYPTWWYTVIDFNQKLYYFGKYNDMTAVYVNLDDALVKNVWSKSQKIMVLAAPGFPLWGDVTSKFSEGSSASLGVLNLASQAGVHDVLAKVRPNALGVMMTCFAASLATLAVLAIKLSKRDWGSKSAALLHHGPGSLDF